MTFRYDLLGCVRHIDSFFTSLGTAILINACILSIAAHTERRGKCFFVYLASVNDYSMKRDEVNSFPITFEAGACLE